jgi:hypothetical protein
MKTALAERALDIVSWQDVADPAVAQSPPHHPKVCPGAGVAMSVMVVVSG